MVKKILRRALGATLVFIPFALSTWYMVAKSGILVALIVWGTTLAVVAILVAGVFLLTGDD